MSTVPSNSRSFIALPLTLAVSTLLISACSNTSAVKNQGVANTSSTVTQSPTNQTTTPTTSATAATPSTTGDYSTAYLDAESLDELADLLEASDMTMVEDNKLAIQQYGDLWNRLRAGYRMNGGQPVYNQRIEGQKGWFTSRQEHLNRLTARASRYIYHTVREAERRNIPTELALLPVIESSYDPSGTSSAAAAGLWQFIPSTGRIYGLNQSRTYDGRRDVIESTRAAYDFLTTLYNQFGSWELALAAYNAGPGRVQNAIDANAARGLPTDYWSLRLPTETMNYVPRFLAVAEIVADPEQYGVYLPAIANRQHFRSVPVNYGVSLSEVAQITGVSYSELERLNTALTSGRVDISGPQRVIIPNDVSTNKDAELSALRGNGTSNVLAGNSMSSTTSSSSTASSPSYNSEPYTNSSLPSTGSALADYAATASVPQQTTSYISPTAASTGSSSYSNTGPSNEPPLTEAETDKINAELKSSNNLPTTSAQLTQNNTIVQEPPLSEEERDFIAQQIRNSTPDANVINADGNINLSAVQTQQSVLEASGGEKKLSFSQTSESKPKPQGTRSTYTVKRGDTLSNIASRAGVSWRDIAEWNEIDASANILSGSTLYLYDAETIEPLSAASNAAESQPESYVVQSGDTLIGTANRFGLSVTQLANYNNLSSRANLLSGQRLWLIPGKVTASTSTAPTTSSTSSSSNSNTSSVDTQNYRVKSGDGLIALARRFNISTSTLASLNDMGTTDSLYVGQTLKIPASVDLSAASTTVSSNSGSTSSVATTNYTVKSGETLIGIANSVGVSATELAAVNSSFDARARLQRGQTIKVPATQETVDRQLNDKTVSYKVKSGDTLTGVARRYNIGLSTLAAANNLTTSSNLIRGRTITIPSSGSAATASSSSSATSTTTNTASSGKKLGNTENYTVKSGDGLIVLARRFGISVADLAATNNLATNAQLQRGQTLKVPKATVSYTVASGDSLIGLARKYGVSTSELAAMNDIAPDTMLQRGQRLTVPNR
ncbi:LysM peptidoglycan-binding domain-containing protein [Psychrobacter sp.]|uniref:LysM peptidoglycan-binding domain-containing protein n=1 Tax=Psychrobacter sp. TaxID=56811 RepID=UPI0026490152|nr:LysM peptidoglycan-binding domain-containing protein [Psychrobacter sp.]MDN6275961.1 LysM peptidoglycan-binding domain-containing protein [Psychrobacter sp.]MDN6307041.1 LysM peptidoglycan-binding domain-containing protein [Psychrobacter sp.]